MGTVEGSPITMLVGPVQFHIHTKYPVVVVNMGFIDGGSLLPHNGYS